LKLPQANLHLDDINFEVLLVEFVLLPETAKVETIPPIGQFFMQEAQQQSPPSQLHANLLFSLLQAPLPIHTPTHRFFSFSIFCLITISE